MANKMKQFTQLLDELSKIGYEADNMDCMKMEYSDGYGTVTFVTKDDVQVRLPFAFWKLDLESVDSCLTFVRKFRVKSPTIGLRRLGMNHTSQEFCIDLKLDVSRDHLIEQMKQASHYLAPIKVESYRDFVI